MRFWQLVAARDTYGKHFEDLSKKERRRVNELAAVAIVEAELHAKMFGATE